MNDTIHKLENGDFVTGSFLDSTEEVLKALYVERLKLYKKGGNDEVLNYKIRVLQKETNYQIRE